jgi:hypothetical protein
MRLKIRCDEESTIHLQNFLKPNWVREKMERLCMDWRCCRLSRERAANAMPTERGGAKGSGSLSESALPRTLLCPG